MSNVVRFPRDEEGGKPFNFVLRISRNREGDASLEMEYDRKPGECLNLADYLIDLGRRIKLTGY